MTSGWTSDVDIDQVLQQVKAAAQQGVRAGADALLDKSNALVPIESGGLRASGRTSAEELKAAVTYGEPGQRTGFAAIQQHEHTEYHHPHGGQAKFLEQPMLSATDEIGQAIAAKIREVLGS